MWIPSKQTHLQRRLFCSINLNVYTDCHSDWLSQLNGSVFSVKAQPRECSSVWGLRHGQIMLICPFPLQCTRQSPQQLPFLQRPSRSIQPFCFVSELCLRVSTHNDNAVMKFGRGYDGGNVNCIDGVQWAKSEIYSLRDKIGIHGRLKRNTLKILQKGNLMYCLMRLIYMF